MVERIQLSLTGSGRDGEWLRVSEYGYFASEVRVWSDLAGHLDVDDLRPVTLELSLACGRLEFGRHVGGELDLPFPGSRLEAGRRAGS